MHFYRMIPRFEDEFKKLIRIPEEEPLLLTVKNMKTIGPLYSAVAASTLDKNYQYYIDQFRSTWFEMADNLKKFNTPPKAHIIMDHLDEYLDLTGKSLAYTSDQHIEATHQRVHRIEKNSNYTRKVKSGMKASLALIRKTRHSNSYNVNNYTLKRKKK